MSDERRDLPPDPLGAVGTTVLGIYLVLLPVALCAVAVGIWPITRPDPSGQGAAVTTSLIADRLGGAFSPDLSLILIVVTVGSLGSYIHSATSFADYVGNRRLAASWVWWYVLRTFIGLALALIFYFVVRGGLLSTGAAAGDVNPFGVAAVSGLVGMFSKQATDKLREVFDTLFRTDRPVARADKLSNPVPEIRSIDPTSGAVGGDVILTITGDHFIARSVATFRGVDRPTTFVSPTQLKVRVPGDALPPSGAAEVTVVNPPPGGGASTAAVFTVE